MERYLTKTEKIAAFPGEVSPCMGNFAADKHFCIKLSYLLGKRSTDSRQISF